MADTMDIPEAAEFLGISSRSLYRLVQAGKPIRQNGREVWPIEIGSRKFFGTQALRDLAARVEEVPA